MPSIFISYSRKELEKISLFVQRFEVETKGKSYDILWDKQIQTGEYFPEEIQEMLDTATIIVVFWSKNSVKSHWVKDEATFGLKRNKIFPIRIDDVEIPLPFENRQTEDLIGLGNKLSEDKLKTIIEKLDNRLSIRIDKESDIFSCVESEEMWIALGGFNKNDPIMDKYFQYYKSKSKSKVKTKYEFCRNEIDKRINDQEFISESLKTVREFITQKEPRHLPDQRDARTALLIAHQIVEAYGTIANHIRSEKESLVGDASSTKDHQAFTNHQLEARNILSQVYLNPVNEFTRDIIEYIIPNESLSKQFGIYVQESSIAGAAKYILNNWKPILKYDPHSRSPEVHAAYILGRIRNHYKAQDTLAEFEKKINENIITTIREINQGSAENLEDTLRHLRLLRRTALLSQAKLGGRRALERYINYLHNSYLEMDINAGFHLEYYCDQPKDDFQPLCSRDYGDSCLNTISYLVNSLQSRMAGGFKGMSEPFTVVEIFTLASIIAKRINKENNQKNSFDFHPALKTLEMTCEHLKILMNSGDLEILPTRNLTLLTDSILFVELLLEVSCSGSDYPIEQFGRYLSAKNAPRNGWIARGVEFPETVGAHTASLLWLCNLLAHYKQSDTNIDLIKLRRMLELHDIAEGITSDIPAGRQSKETKEHERQHMRKLSWLGIYLKPNLDLFDTYEIYKDFLDQGSLTANIAHDLDRLDMVIQGNSILKSDAVCDRKSIKNLINDSENLIATEQVRELLPLVKKLIVITKESFGLSDSRVKSYYFSS